MRTTKTLTTKVVIDINNKTTSTNVNLTSKLEETLINPEWTILSFTIKSCEIEDNKLSFMVEVVLLSIQK